MNRLQDVEDKNRIRRLSNADVEVISDEDFAAW
jgi:hypothetical protein